MKKIKLALMLVLLLMAAQTQAQCTFRNTAFKSGEFLTYNLYFNWKFIWVKAGTASMSVVQSVYGGKPAYRGSLITRGNSKVDNFFVTLPWIWPRSTTEKGRTRVAVTR